MTNLERIAAILALSCALAPNPVLAESSPRQVLVSALEAESCILTIESMEGISLASGLKRETLQIAARELLNDGSIAAVSNDVMYLRTGDLCDGFEGPPVGDVDPTVTAALLRKFEQANCRLSFGEFAEGLEDQFDSEKIDAAAFALMNDGSLKLKNEYATLNTGQACEGAADRPLSEIERLPELNRAVIAEFGAHECMIAEADFPQTFHPAEIEIINAMIDAGTMIKTGSSDGYRMVIGPDCGPT